MAYNSNGQPYRGQNSQCHTPRQQQQQQPQSQPGRQSSFDAGDDRAYFDEGGGAGGGAHSSVGRTGGFVRMPDLAQYTPGAGGPASANPPHQGSHYSQQSQPAVAAYNPQQYARAEQHTGSSYASPSVGSPPSLTYQPYVPAAYQAPTPTQTSSYGFSSYDPSSNYQSPAYQVAGQGPSSPSEQSYSQRTDQTSTSPYLSHHSSYSSPHHSPPPLPHRGATSPHIHSTYTPPAPPPPPSSSFDQYNERQAPPPPGRPHANEQSQQAPGEWRPSTGQSVGHHRLPSLPDYGNSADYLTQAQHSQHPTSFQASSKPSPGPPLPPVPQYPAQRSNVSNRRPLPGTPRQQDEGSSVPNPSNPSRPPGSDHFGYDDILKEVEEAVMGHTPTSSRHSPGQSTGRIQRQDSIREEEEPPPLFNTRSETRQSISNGTSSGLHINYGAYSDDSDAEAAAGLAALRMAEEQDAADDAWRNNSLSGQSRSSTLDSNHPLPPPPLNGSSSDSDVLVDMDTYGGGGGFPREVSYHYGTSQSQGHLRPNPEMHRHSSSATSPPYSDVSNETLAMPPGDYYMAGESSIHPFPSFGARTDTGGTGGLSEPSEMGRRMSFEDGDEATLVDQFDHTSSGATSPARESMRSRGSFQESQHRRTNSRPLPHVPGRRGAVDYQTLQPDSQYSGYPQAPDEFGQNLIPGNAAVQKANSVGSHSATPPVVPPGRSITDAEQRRKIQVMTGGRSTMINDGTLSPDSALSNQGNIGEMLLPSIPAGKRRKFQPSKLSTHDYKRCPEPWALSSILAWIKEMTEGEADLKEHAIVDGLVALFTHKVPTMNTADAEVLSNALVQEMFSEGALLRDEEWVKFSSRQMSGVLFQLTGTGCYSPMVHNSTIPGRCYSHHCMRTLKKINLQTHNLAPQRKAEDWATFYKLKKADVENVSKKDVERQNNLHEIVTSEDYYMDQLNVLLMLYRDGLAHSPQPILSPKRLEEFIRECFGKVDAVKKANEDYLLAQLKYRQEEQGPWIRGFSDIFREWIRKAKIAYVDYAANFPAATFKIRKEAERNVLFRQFLEQMRENERSRRLGWDTYLKAPITRLQRYGLLLATVHKNMVGESEEKTNLGVAIEEIKVVTLECDTRVAEMGKRADMLDLQSKLRLRPGMEKVQLNLNHLGREIIFRGDLQRRGNNKVSWVDTHAILFDHYMVLAKPIQQRDAAGGLKHEVYDVSKLPIPMDLLVLESTNDDPIVKSTVKNLAAGTRAQTPQEARAGRGSHSGPGPGTLTALSHTQTGGSVSSGGSKTLVTTTVLDGGGNSDKLLFPFRVKHLGKAEVYVLYTATSQNRQDWCDKIIEAKTRHAASLFAQNAEPFRLRVLADTAFHYDSTSGGPQGIVIKGTPLDRAIEECDKSFYGTGSRPGAICRAQINCATSFMRPYGDRMLAIGTDFGVYLSDYKSARGWAKAAAITSTHVTQIAVIEEFSLFIIIADKSLIAYHLESVCPPAPGGPPASAGRPPQKLSGNRDVGFFASGRMKDRNLVFYKKKEGISSTFKVLEPVYQKSATSSRSRFGLKKGSTDFFRDFDDFYIPSETYAINLFSSSLAISTARGVEVLTLDKKVPFSIPDLRAPAVASIAARINGQKPLGMFRLNDNEFLLVFEEVGIYVDKHGDVSRAVVMEFVGRAKQATLYNNTYLVLVDSSSGFVEVRNAINGRLRQMVSGRDVKLLDDGGIEGTVKISLQHPERERVQLVVELIVNEGLKE